MLTTTSELKTLIVLTGNRRIEHMEQEIFANRELTELYAHTLCRDLASNIYRPSTAYLLVFYASQVIKQRWLVAEPIIAKDRSVAHYYDSHFKTDLSKTGTFVR